MESTSDRKRPFDDVASSDPPSERRARFPKGKKAKRGVEKLPVGGDDVPSEAATTQGEANLAAMERAKRRTKMIEEEVVGEQLHGGTLEEILRRSEVNYEENASFDDDGIQIEPFNLKYEREEGYFDESGNYVEFLRNDEIKDAWLDSLDLEMKFVEQKPVNTTEREEEEYCDLSTTEIVRIKRSIVSMLKPGETVMQALRRLKGTGGDKKQKMPDETRHIFDLLTENAVKLMENGEYNVYHEERETFEREAEGYERIIRAKEDCLNGKHESEIIQHFSEGKETQEGYTSILDKDFTPLETNVAPENAEGEVDMFGDDENEENASAIPNDSENTENVDDANPTSSEHIQEHKSELENDFVFDDLTGYYYSSSMGYYYDPGSGLYCSAVSGKWYAYDGQSGSYYEIESQIESQDTARVR